MILFLFLLDTIFRKIIEQCYMTKKLSFKSASILF